MGALVFGFVCVGDIAPPKSEAYPPRIWNRGYGTSVQVSATWNLCWAKLPKLSTNATTAGTSTTIKDTTTVGFDMETMASPNLYSGNYGNYGNNYGGSYYGTSL